jgi:hypothetical protein
LTFDNERQLLSYVAKHWERVTTALSSELLQRLSRYGGNEWWLWDNLAPFIGESAAARIDFLGYCARETTPLSGRAIEALAREMPRSHLLREHCLRCLGSRPRDDSASAYDQRRRELVVGRVLGRQFARDSGVRGELERHALFSPSAAIVGLVLAWKDSAVLTHEFASLRAHGHEAGRFVWPDAAYLIGAFGSRDEFCSFLSHIVENTSGSIWDFLSFCIEPLVARLRAEDELATQIVTRLTRTKSGSEKASFPRLLAMADHMSDLNEEPAQVLERRAINLRRAERRGGAGRRIQHPARHHDDHAGVRFDEAQPRAVPDFAVMQP